MAIQAQFYGSREWPAGENGFVSGVVAGGGGGGFSNSNSCFVINNLELHHQLKQQQRNGGELINNGVSVSKIDDEKPALASVGLPINHSHNPMAAYEQKQRQEIDHYIKLQNERLRLALLEQRKQHLSLLLKTLETKATILLRQKDDEISRAARRATELETFLRKLEMENQAWQRAARESEAASVSLSRALVQARENSSLMMMNRISGGFVGENDAESCCGERGDGEKATRRNGVVCRRCECREACVLFLPCRHLGSCGACEGFVDRCPVCETTKKGCVEALLMD